MFGFDTISAYNEAYPKPIKGKITAAKRNELAWRKKYATRYHIDKILTDLELSWGLRRYSNHSRGMFISYKATIERLAMVCEATKRSTRVAGLLAQKQAARQAATKQHKAST